MSDSRLFFVPMGGGGIDPTNYYTKDQVDALIADFVTASTDDLVNYYLKSETYSQSEVDAMIGAISQFHYEIYPTLASVTDPQTNVLYLIGPSATATGDLYEEYVYSNSTFVKIGDTSIDLSGYVTTTDLNTALADYTPTADLATVATTGDYEDLINKPVIPETSNDWFGNQAQFDALPNKDANTNYWISDKISYSEIKGTPDVYTKTEINSTVTNLEGDIAGKENNIQFMTAQEYAAATKKEGTTYAIEGETVQLTFTLSDQTTVTHNFVIDD